MHVWLSTRPRAGPRSLYRLCCTSRSPSRRARLGSPCTGYLARNLSRHQSPLPTSSIIRNRIITINNSHCSSQTIIVLDPNLATEPPRPPCNNLPQELRANIPPSAMYLTDQSKPSTLPNPHQLYLLYLGTTTSTQIFLPVPPTASSQTLLNTATLLPTSTLMPNPLIPPSPQTLGTDSTMNLIFGLSAFVMAGITIWQNRHYLRAIKMPWGKEVCYPSPSTSTDIELTGDRTRRIEDNVHHELQIEHLPFESQSLCIAITSHALLL